MDFRIGTLIRGKYRIDSILGQGGMGVVVGAHHLALDQRVAIKFLLPEMRQYPAVVDRFAREARAASKIRSDHVAHVMDVDTLDDGTPFMVMEHLEGTDLAAVRDSGKGLPTHLAVGYILEACEAVAEAHRLGIIHRDLKPANLFLAQRGDGRTRVKVLDFGISKSREPSSEVSVTAVHAVMGTAEYMSPEQMLSSKDADARSDIWALGICLYELLTATVPFQAESLTQMCALVLQTQPKPPSSVRPDISKTLDAIVLRCIAKDRNARFDSVEELMSALRPFARELAPDSLRNGSLDLTYVSGLAGAEAKSGRITETSSVVVDGPPRPKSSKVWPLAGLGIVSLLALAVWTTFARPRTDAPKTSETPEPAASAPVSAPVSTSLVVVSLGPSPSEAAVPQSSPTIPTPTTQPVATSAPHSTSTARAVSAQPSPLATHDRASPTSTPTPTGAPAPTSESHAAKNCNPPFTLDANGDRHAKPECL